MREIGTNRGHAMCGKGNFGACCFAKTHQTTASKKGNATVEKQQ